MKPAHNRLQRVGDLATTDNAVYLVVNNKIVINFMTLLYTPGQLRTAVSIGPETFRHWKKALEPLRRARGHSPCFRSGDLVALAVVRLLTLDMGIRVGALTSIGEALFDLCNRSPWPVMERAKLIIDLPNSVLLLRSELAETPTDKPYVTIPLSPVITQLREQLLAAGNEDEQSSLRFPPVEIAPAVASRGGRP